MSWSHDIVIVGGGVGGAVLGYMLTALGLDVCLLEKHKLPRYKPCGGGLTPRALKEFPLDIKEVLEVECYQASLEFRTKPIYKKESFIPIVSMIMRDRLDHYILLKAKDLCMTLKEGTKFLDIKGTWGDYVIATNNGNIKTKIIIGADGALSQVAQKTQIQRPNPWVWALETELEPKNQREMERFGSVARFDIGYEGSGYSWAFPKARHLSVGTSTINIASSRSKENLQLYIKALGISDWVIKKKAFHPIPFRSTPFPKKPPPKAILIGDAAGLTDPITGEGIYYAIKSAKIFKDVLNEYMDYPELMHAFYYQKLEEELFSELWYAHKIAHSFYSRPMLLHSLILLFGKSFVQRYYSIISGEKNYKSLVNVFILNLILKGAHTNEKRRNKRQKQNVG